MSKVMANRIAPLLHHVIHADQTGFMRSRQISDNCRITIDLLTRAKQKRWVGAILYLDWERAYDVCDWGWIRKCVARIGFDVSARFGFGNMLNTLHHGACRRVSINGVLGEAFTIRSSVPQDCPLSALLYIISAEPLHNYIREDKAVKGIPMPDGTAL